MEIIKTAKMSTKGQIVIPHSIREILGLETEDEMVMTIKGEAIVMRKIHLGDIIKEGRRERKAGKAVSYNDMKNRYGV